MKSIEGLFAIAATMLLTSCYTVSYFGDKLPATTTPTEVYYAASDVKRPYKVLGHLSCPKTNQETVKAKLSAYAQSIGADGIIILGTEYAGKDSPDAVKADAIKYTGN